MKKKSRRKPGHVTHNRYELLLKSEYKGACWAALPIKTLRSKTDEHLLPNPTKKTTCKF